MRNSSLVKWFCAENVTGLKPATEATDLLAATPGDGRGAFSGERSRDASHGGPQRRENAGISSERQARNLSAEHLRFPGEG